MTSFASMPNPRSSTNARSAFASCDLIYIEDSDDDDDCQVVGVRLPSREEAAAPSRPASQNSSNSSWSTGNAKEEKRPIMQPQCRGEAKTANGNSNGPVRPEFVSDNQQNLRREWKAAMLRRRKWPPMPSGGSKVGTNGHWGSRAQQSTSILRETESSANLGEESGTVEIVQSNGHFSPEEDVNFHNPSERSSLYADLAVHPKIEPRENGDAEPKEVVSGSRKHPAPAPTTDDQVLRESSSNSVSRNREDPPFNMESPYKFAKVSCSTEVKKGSKRWCTSEDAHDAALTLFKLRTNGTEQDIVGAKDKLKETVDYKQADKEEWERRQQEVQKQAQEARKQRERQRAEVARKNEAELRLKQRLEEMHQTWKKEERNLALKDQIRGKAQADLEHLGSRCRDMATLLRLLQIPVEGGIAPTQQQVHAAYKKALLRYHPDRTLANAQGDLKCQVEAEETFKFIQRMRPILLRA